MNKKKVTRHNILHALYDREINGIKTRMNFMKSTYKVINPNCTILNVEKPPCFPRKFTPDGRYFIAFSEDKLFIEVYAYLGCSMAAKLLKNYEENCIGQDKNGDVARKRIFESLFQLKHRVSIKIEGEQFRIKFSLFIPNTSYVILASEGDYNFIDLHDPDEIFSSNEALTPHLLCDIANYTLHLVNIENGTVSQRIHFKQDKIYLSHNNGVYLLKDVLVILSVHHQIIHVYKLIENRYHLLRKIGRFCFENDLAFISSVHPDIIAEDYQPNKDTITNGLKNKLMIFLYKKAERESELAKTQYPLRRFYQYYDHFMSLRMWKMQLIDVDHIFIKYALEDVVNGKIRESDTQESSYFMIYNMTTATVLNFYENSSSDLLHGYEYFCDNFRNPYLNPDGFMPCSPSNNIYSRDSLNAEFIGTMDAKKLRLHVLPIAAQSFSCSPYLDMSLYSYNERCVSTMERPKCVFEHPIRFYSRESGTPSFDLYISVSRNRPIMKNLYSIEFIFHPTDPFAISVQLDNLDVNFHIRKVYLPE